MRIAHGAVPRPAAEVEQAHARRCMEVERAAVHVPVGVPGPLFLAENRVEAELVGYVRRRGTPGELVVIRSLALLTFRQVAAIHGVLWSWRKVRTAGLRGNTRRWARDPSGSGPPRVRSAGPATVSGAADRHDAPSSSLHDKLGGTEVALRGSGGVFRAPRTGKVESHVGGDAAVLKFRERKGIRTRVRTSFIALPLCR
jgi:hypothetical protein